MCLYQNANGPQAEAAEVEVMRGILVLEEVRALMRAPTMARRDTDDAVRTVAKVFEVTRYRPT